MNPFLLTPPERLDHWAAFRDELRNFDDATRIQKVADYFTKAPLSNFAYDVTSPDTWPTPWEMIAANDWCRQSIAIGMEATLRLSGFDPSRLTLMAFGTEECDRNLILKIDRQTTLNYIWGQPSYQLPDVLFVHGLWRHTGRKYVPVQD
jgi:hypothetical protein